MENYISVMAVFYILGALIAIAFALLLIAVKKH